MFCLNLLAACFLKLYCRSFFFRLFRLETHNIRSMKPKEISKIFSGYIEEGTTPKGVKIQSFFSHLTSSQKGVFAKNIAKAYTSFLEEEKEMSDLRKKRKKDISELKKKAKELGLTIS